MNQPQAVVYRGDFFSSLVGERVQRTVIPFAVLRPAFTFYHRLPMILFTAYALSMATLGVTVETDGFDSRAVAAAVQRAGPGDTIRFAAGIYRLDEPIRPKSKTRLIGAGQEKTLVVYRGTRNAVFVELAGCEDLELAGMTLDGENSRHLNQGISGTNSRRLWLHHLTIRNLADVKTWGPHAILFSGHNPTAKQGVTDSRITDCRIENIGVGAEYGGGIRLAWGSDRNEVAGNTIYKTGRGGIFGDHSVELRIHGNRVSGSGGEGLGIEIWGGCLRSLIEDNLIDHWLSVDQGTQSAVRRNVIGADDGSLKGFGIEIIARNVVVTDNVVNQGAHIGLSVSNVPVKNNVFWGYNTFRDCAQWALNFKGKAAGLRGITSIAARSRERSAGIHGPCIRTTAATASAPMASAATWCSRSARSPRTAAAACSSVARMWIACLSSARQSPAMPRPRSLAPIGTRLWSSKTARFGTTGTTGCPRARRSRTRRPRQTSAFPRSFGQEKRHSSDAIPERPWAKSPNGCGTSATASRR